MRGLWRSPSPNRPGWNTTLPVRGTHLRDLTPMSHTCESMEDPGVFVSCSERQDLARSLKLHQSQEGTGQYLIPASLSPQKFRRHTCTVKYDCTVHRQEATLFGVFFLTCRHNCGWRPIHDDSDIRVVIRRFSSGQCWYDSLSNGGEVSFLLGKETTARKPPEKPKALTIPRRLTLPGVSVVRERACGRHGGVTRPSAPVSSRVV